MHINFMNMELIMVSISIGNVYKNRNSHVVHEFSKVATSWLKVLYSSSDDKNG